jgi:pseudouridine kinase
MDVPLRNFNRVTVFGGATIDRVARSDGTPVMGASNPGHAYRIAGGVGYNVAAVLARVGVKTQLVARIGDDPDGEAIIAACAAAGIDTRAISVSAEKPTAGYYATFDDGGELIIGIADMDICGELTPAVVRPAAAAAATTADFWVIDANLPADTLDFLVEQAAVTGTPVAALSVSPVKVMRLAPLLDRLTLLVINRREAAALLGRDPNAAGSTAALAAELSGTRATRIIVTSGGDPVIASRAGQARAFLPLKTDISAVNGAGDSFAAGTIAAMAKGRSLNEAIRFGLAAAAMTIEHGSIAAAPFAPEALAERIAAGPKAK